MDRSRQLVARLVPLLLLTLPGCMTMGRAAAWPVQETLSLASNITLHATTTAISAAAGTVEYTARKGVDTAFAVASDVITDEAVEMVIEGGMDRAIGRELRDPAAAILEKVLD